MESTPAWDAQRMPCAPCAWAATLRPRRCASATMAFISSSVYCEAWGLSPCESTPPVAQILIRSAPYLMVSRTLCCTPSTPSATPSAVYVVFEGQQVLVAVASGNAERRPAHQHARPGHIAGVDGVAQRHVAVALRSHIAHGSETGLESKTRIARADQG